jgi:hypothetical protein
MVISPWLAPFKNKSPDDSEWALANSSHIDGIRVVLDSAGSPPPDYFLAMLYALLGHKDRAFYWLERGYRERSPAYSALNVDPCWASFDLILGLRILCAALDSRLGHSK